VKPYQTPENYIDQLTMGLPDELKRRKAFVVWKLKPGAKGKKPGKIPHYPNGRRRQGRQGTDTDLANLGTFQEAMKAFEQGNYAGIGIAMLPGMNLTAIDLDHCFVSDGIKRELAPLVADTYAEKSPGLDGVRAFYRGTYPKNQNHELGLEVFDAGQFVTITGLAINANPIIDIPDQVRRQLDRLFKKNGQSAAAPTDNKDPLYRHLLDQGWKTAQGGKLFGPCPFAEQHTTADGPGDCAYLPPTGGYKLGNVRCLHNHCRGRSRAEMLAGVGFQEKRPPRSRNTPPPHPGPDSSAQASGNQRPARNGPRTEGQQPPSGDAWSNQPIPQRIRDMAMCYPGQSLSSDFIAREIGVTTPQRNYFRVCLARLVESGGLVRLDAGRFFVPEPEEETCDWTTEETCRHLDVYFPFGLDAIAAFEPGSQALIAGTYNSGKSAIATGLSYHNAPAHKIRFLSTEFSPGDFRRRMEVLAKRDGRSLSYYKSRIDFLRVKTIEGIHLKLLTEPRTINIIDYLEITDAFYAVAARLAEIHASQGESLTVAFIQKKPREQMPLGGHFAMHKPHLALLLDSLPGKRGVVTASKIKQYREGFLERDVPIDGKKFYYGFDPTGSIIVPLAGGRWYNPDVKVTL